MKYYFVAFDLGATSGRTILGTVSDGKLSLEEINRFPNRMLRLNGRLHWNIYALYEHLKEGLQMVARKNVPITSIGIDTWGCDFVCLDKDGDIIGLPVAYRDPYTKGMKERFFKEIMPADELYAHTGIQHMDFNTVFQLYAMKQHDAFALGSAHKVLFMPDALSYMLTGQMVMEYTVASTSQLLDPWKRQLDMELLDSMGLDASLFPETVEPGTRIGVLRPDLQEELRVAAIPVVAVAGHDTASAVASVPATDGCFAYLSSGTWSLMGIETTHPVINERTTGFNITNEGGVDGTIRLLKNITGMWLVEQCLQSWSREGVNYTYPQVVEMAEQARPFVCFIDPDDPMFTCPQDMPQAICDYCNRTRQETPRTHGEFLRCIFECLALKYREVLDIFEELSEHPVHRLHVIGGGSRNVLLNRFTANAIGKPVVAGPGEASALGNILLQARAAGIVDTLQDIRNRVVDSVQLECFVPEEHEYWQSIYEKYLFIIKHKA